MIHLYLCLKFCGFIVVPISLILSSEPLDLFLQAGYSLLPIPLLCLVLDLSVCPCTRRLEAFAEDRIVQLMNLPLQTRYILQFPKLCY